MNKKLKAISLLHPSLFGGNELNLFTFLKLEKKIVNDLMNLKLKKKLSWLPCKTT